MCIQYTFASNFFVLYFEITGLLLFISICTSDLDSFFKSQILYIFTLDFIMSADTLHLNGKEALSGFFFKVMIL